MDELIIDSFAGGGGASLGITWALGRHPDVAINHDAEAITMHKANHPTTTHYTEDVWRLSPRRVTKGRPVGLLWASPDCKHFSRAKGSKPVEKKIRSLAWVVVKWAEQSKPRLIILENVREFEQWGPLIPRWRCESCDWKGTEGQARLERQRRACPRCDSRSLRRTDDLIPDPDRMGLTFKRFAGRLRNLGYEVQWRVLDAADYGAPTHRRRLFLIARRDGQAIVWPAPTHADPKKAGAGLFALEPWKTAAQCIDFTIPCPSIFDRKKPLVEATMRRIAFGIKRYVLDNPRPFIVDMQRDNRSKGADEPLGTVTTQGNRFNIVEPVIAPLTVGAGGPEYSGKPRPADKPFGAVMPANHSAMVTPYLVRCNHGGEETWQRNRSVEEPMFAATGSRGEAVIAPTLVQIGYGEREGQAPRSLDLNKPMGTAVAGGSKQALIAAFLHRYYGASVGQPVDEPGPTESKNPHSSIVTAYIAKHFGGVVGCPADTPLPTTTARGTQNQVVAANLVHLNHGGKQWSGADEPMRAATAGGNHAFLVYSFLVKYFGQSIGQAIDEPLGTATTKDRFGVVLVEIDGETYVIVDIGMRMLTPRELARGQGFPDSYVLTGSNTSQVARIGNSVCPQAAAALAAANYAADQPRATREGAA